MAVAVPMRLQPLGAFGLRARVVLDKSRKGGKAKASLELAALTPDHRLHRERVTEAGMIVRGRAPLERPGRRSMGHRRPDGGWLPLSRTKPRASNPTGASVRDRT